MADEGSQQRKPDVRTAVADAKALARVLAREAESILGRRAAQVLGVIVLFAVVVGVLLALLNWYIAPTDAEQKQALVVTLAQILGGTALLSGLYFTWRTLQVNREGQITERFTKAIDQLGKVDDDGNKLFEIRLGGIYALERIARESDNDYWPIMEVLTAYVREHAPWPLEEGQTRGDGVAKEKPGEDSNAEPASTDIPPPDPDVQAIMTVIGRRTHYRRQEETELLDLRGIDLRGADLRKANFVGADLSGANFSRAELRGADLRNAKLMGANLSETFLWKTNLSQAQLHGANLSAANLVDADLSEVNKKPSESKMYHPVYLSRANLSGANLMGAKLMGADLWGANLSEANLMGADLRGANLSEANDLAQEQVEHVRGDETTTLPDHLTPPAYWSVNSDEPPESG